MRNPILMCGLNTIDIGLSIMPFATGVGCKGFFNLPNKGYMRMQFPHKCTINIVGKKNSGKSTLMQFLIRELSQSGIKVGALKHSSHNHPIDKVGSDSDYFRNAGATPVVFSTPDGFTATFSPVNEHKQIQIWEHLFAVCDIVLIESFREAEGPKLWICNDPSRDTIPANTIAIISANLSFPDIPVFTPNDPKLVHWITLKFNL